MHQFRDRRLDDVDVGLCSQRAAQRHDKAAMMEAAALVVSRWAQWSAPSVARRQFVHGWVLEAHRVAGHEEHVVSGGRHCIDALERIAQA